MKRLAVVACTALAVTAFSACGDDDDDDTPEGSTPAAVTEGGAMTTPLDSGDTIATTPGS